MGECKRSNSSALTFDGHTNLVWSVAASYDRQWVVSGSIDKSVLFWDARKAQVQFALHAHKDWVVSVDMSPTNGFFATVGDDKVIRICEFLNNTLLSSFHTD